MNCFKNTTIKKLEALKIKYERDRQEEESHGDGDGHQRLSWYDRRIKEINNALRSNI